MSRSEVKIQEGIILGGDWSVGRYSAHNLTVIIELFYKSKVVTTRSISSHIANGDVF